MHTLTIASVFFGQVEKSKFADGHSTVRALAKQVSVSGDRSTQIESAVASSTAQFESQVAATRDGEFVESGRIEYGSGNTLKFTTLTAGSVVKDSEVEGCVTGGIIWKVDGGSGLFDGVVGVISSNFMSMADGSLVDHQVAALIFR